MELISSNLGYLCRTFLFFKFGQVCRGCMALGIRLVSTRNKNQKTETAKEEKAIQGGKKRY